jgi:hypothetical protein
MEQMNRPVNIADYPTVEDYLDSPALERALAQEDGRAAEAHLAAGRTIYYGDPDYPGLLVKEFPGGRRQLIKVARGGAETLVREMP